LSGFQLLIAMTLALAAGLMTGLLFGPLAIIPVAILFLAIVFAATGTLGVPWIVSAIVVVIAVNVGYLLGALIARNVR
jgi:hypothetical protein